MVGRERPRSMTVNAPFPRHSSRIFIKRLVPLYPSSSCEEWFYEPDYEEGEFDSEWYTKKSFQILIVNSPLPLTQSPSRQNQCSFLATQCGTRNHSHSHLFPHSPPPSLTELPITYHPNARPLFVRFFIHYLFFQFREQPLLTHPNVPYLFPLVLLAHPILTVILILQTSSPSEHPCRLRLQNRQPVLCVLALPYALDLRSTGSFSILFLGRLSIRRGSGCAHGRGG